MEERLRLYQIVRITKAGKRTLLMGGYMQFPYYLAPGDSIVCEDVTPAPHKSAYDSRPVHVPDKRTVYYLPRTTATSVLPDFDPWNTPGPDHCTIKRPLLADKDLKWGRGKDGLFHYYSWHSCDQHAMWVRWD